jgi:hypothetical protein
MCITTACKQVAAIYTYDKVILLVADHTNIINKPALSFCKFKTEAPLKHQNLSDEDVTSGVLEKARL